MIIYGMRCHRNSISGGVAMRVIVCAASLIVLAAAIVVLLDTFRQGKEEDHRRAARLATEGLERAYMELDPSWTTAELKDELTKEEGGGGYGVVITREEKDGIVDIKILSTGTSGSVTKTEESTVRMRLSVSEDGDSTWDREVIYGTSRRTGN
jgi:hypothetical protein